MTRRAFIIGAGLAAVAPLALIAAEAATNVKAVYREEPYPGAYLVPADNAGVGTMLVEKLDGRYYMARATERIGRWVRFEVLPGPQNFPDSFG